MAMVKYPSMTGPKVDFDLSRYQFPHDAKGRQCEPA